MARSGCRRAGRRVASRHVVADHDAWPRLSCHVAQVQADTWWAIELCAWAEVPEWGTPGRSAQAGRAAGGQRVQFRQEEDAAIAGRQGAVNQWVLARQEEMHLVA